MTVAKRRRIPVWYRAAANESNAGRIPQNKKFQTNLTPGEIE
jgi:hypothetical protein